MKGVPDEASVSSKNLDVLVDGAHVRCASNKSGDGSCKQERRIS